jgi:hypothetical protein
VDSGINAAIFLFSRVAEIDEDDLNRDGVPSLDSSLQHDEHADFGAYVSPQMHAEEPVFEWGHLKGSTAADNHTCAFHGPLPSSPFVY